MQPVIEFRQTAEHRQLVPDAVTGVLYVLLDLPLLPAGRRVAELGIEQVVAHHGSEADVDVTLLAASHLVYCGPHVVVDATGGHATECSEGMVVRVEQHLVCLERVGTQEEGSAMTQLEVGDL